MWLHAGYVCAIVSLFAQRGFVAVGADERGTERLCRMVKYALRGSKGSAGCAAVLPALTATLRESFRQVQHASHLFAASETVRASLRWMHMSIFSCCVAYEGAACSCATALHTSGLPCCIPYDTQADGALHTIPPFRCVGRQALEEGRWLVFMRCEQSGRSITAELQSVSRNCSARNSVALTVQRRG